MEELRAKPPPRRGDRDMARLLSQAAERWEENGRPLVSSRGAYTRSCAYADDDFELLLLNWDAAATSAIHDHGDQHCWMLVLRGILHVEDYVRLDAADVPGYADVEATGSRLLAPGGLDARSGRFDLHRVCAPRSSGAVSLHVYSGRLSNYLIYDPSTRRCETASSSNDDVLSAYASAHRA